MYVLAPAGSSAGAVSNAGTDHALKNGRPRADGAAGDTEKGGAKAGSSKPGSNEEQGITAGQRAAMERELQRTGVVLDKVLERYGIGDLNEMTGDMYNKAMRGLKKSRSAQAAA